MQTNLNNLILFLPFLPLDTVKQDSETVTRADGVLPMSFVSLFYFQFFNFSRKKKRTRHTLAAIILHNSFFSLLCSNSRFPSSELLVLRIPCWIPYRSVSYVYIYIYIYIYHYFFYPPLCLCIRRRERVRSTSPELQSTSAVSREPHYDHTIRAKDVLELGTEPINSRYVFTLNFRLTVKLKPLERKILYRVISIASAVEC
jgi:hypothetical protein